MTIPKLTFSRRIRGYIFGKIRQELHSLGGAKEIENLLTKRFVFIDTEEDKEFVEDLIQFVNKKDILPIVKKTVRFCYPREFPQPGGVVAYSFSFGGESADLIRIFDDFILNTVRKFCGDKDFERKLGKEWKDFEQEFFSDNIKLRFAAPLARFYYHAGGVIEELIPKKGVTIRYLHPDIPKERADIYNLKASLESSFRPVCKQELDTCPIIVEFKIMGDKSRKITEYFGEAAEIFEKITFVLRLICNGSVHFGFIEVFCLGNYTETHLIQSYPINRLFSNNRQSTTIRSGPYETWVKRAWKAIDSRNISEWHFANQKLRDSYSRASASDEYYFFDPSYKMSRQLERLVDLIQALEYTIGDYGYHIAEYVGKLISRGDTKREEEIKNKILPLYILRDKYLHGKPRGKDSVESTFRSSFQGKIELLEENIDSLEYFLKQVLLVSVLNLDLKEKLEKYHESLGRPIMRVIRKPAKPKKFPHLKTIYY